ncbi:MAG: pyridoxamine 5'-phosphate oxidase [Balneolaceae bacterium]
MTELNIADLRKKYTKGGLSEEYLPDEPVSLFKQWFEEALRSEVMEPNAMSLATVNENNEPNVRVVLLKGMKENKIWFFTNYESRKGKELKVHPVASCALWWPELERQVRLTGSVEKIPEKDCEEYFRSRPRESKIGAWASDQSHIVKNRSALEKRFNELEQEFEGKEIPKPEYWGGYYLNYMEIEFWQGRPGRMHDRIVYQLLKGAWTRKRLAP